MRGTLDDGSLVSLAGFYEVSPQYTVTFLPGLDKVRTLNIFMPSTRRIVFSPSLSSLESLSIDATKDLAELVDLCVLTSLRTLVCRNASLRELKGLSSLTLLETLDCEGNQLKALDVSANVALRHLVYTKNTIGVLTGSSNLTSLEKLHCGNNPQMQSVPELCASVRDIRVRGNVYLRLSAMESFTNLQVLDLSRTFINDITQVTCLTTLRSFNCSNSRVVDISCLTSLVNLTELSVSGNRIYSMCDLRSLTRLQKLQCNQTLIRTLPSLSALVSLKYLSCHHCYINELGEFPPSLRSLNCSNNPIVELNDLERLHTLRELRCHHTNIRKLPRLPFLHVLRAVNTTDTLLSWRLRASGNTIAQCATFVTNMTIVIQDREARASAVAVLGVAKRRRAIRDVLGLIAPLIWKMRREL